MKNLIKNLMLILGVAMAIVACSQTKEKTDNMDDVDTSTPVYEPTESYESVTTELMSKSGSSLKGEVTFREISDDRINLQIDLRGVAPGKHAVHIHQTGDCSAADGSSAGGHWNPMNVKHGNRMEDEEFHKGDIGNITVNSDSTGSMSVDIEGWNIDGLANSDILGKAVIVHAGADDFTSQPSGAAGDRIGCGVINN